VKLNDNPERDPRLAAIPDIHGHAKGEHKPYLEERPIPLSARMLFLWFFHACRRGFPRFMMVADHMNYLTFEDPAAVNLLRRALKLAEAGDLHGAADTAGVEVGHAAVVSEGLRRGMRFSIGAEVDNDPRSRPDAQNIVDAMKPDGMIRSVHFLSITHPTHGEGWHWPFDNPEFKEHYETLGTQAVWDIYMTTLLDAIERLPGQIIGHFYVPAAFGHWPDDAALEAYEDRFVEACEKFGKAIEFNTRFLYRDHPEDEKERYVAAYTRLLKKAKDRGVGIAVGSDAHSPRDQGHKFDVVLRVLDACEINELVFPIAGRLARVALRVERKPEPEPPPPPEPTPEPAVRKARATASPARPKPVKAAKAAKPVPADEPTPPPAAEAAPVTMTATAAEPEPDAVPSEPASAAPEPAAAAKQHAARPAKAKPVAAKSAPRASAAAARGKAKPAPAAKKPAAKAKKAAPKTAASKKATVKKAAPKKAVAAKAKPVAALKGSAKKAKAVRVTAKKAAPVRSAAKKPAAKKSAAPARGSGKKTAAKKAPAKKPAKRR
jgi:HisJ family histidinol phosphate phosphatase